MCSVTAPNLNVFIQVTYSVKNNPWVRKCNFKLYRRFDLYLHPETVHRNIFLGAIFKTVGTDLVRAFP